MSDDPTIHFGDLDDEARERLLRQLHVIIGRCPHWAITEALLLRKDKMQLLRINLDIAQHLWWSEGEQLRREHEAAAAAASQEAAP